MSVKGILARGHTRAEALMLDTGEFQRKTGQTFDPDTGQYTPTFTPVFTSKCRIKAARKASMAEAGETEIVLTQYEIVLPWPSTPPVQYGDRFTATVSEDPWLVGVPMSVVDPEFATARTARHVLVEKVA